MHKPPHPTLAKARGGYFDISLLKTCYTCRTQDPLQKIYIYIIVERSWLYESRT